MKLFPAPEIRQMVVRRDIITVTRIDRESFEHPWLPEAFVSKLTGHSSSHVAMVAEYATLVVGYIVYRISSADISVQRLAVDEKFRRRGIATSLLHAVAELNKGRRETMSAIVDEYDLPLQQFLRDRCGFRWRATLSAQFNNDRRDKYRMVRSIAGVAPAKAPAMAVAAS